MMSTPPAGVYGTITRTGFDGYCCAKAPAHNGSVAHRKIRMDEDLTRGPVDRASVNLTLTA